ncbi:MAG: hypothetical protein AAGF53_12185 [Pseudomonadota bacterium]
MSRIRFCLLGLAIATTALVAAGPAGAKETFLVELRKVDSSCGNSLTCINGSKPVLRNIISLVQADQWALMEFFGRVTSARDVPEHSSSVEYLTNRFDGQETFEKVSGLKGLKALHVDLSKLKGDQHGGALSESVRKMLKEAGIREVSKKDLDGIPGRPVLSVSYSARKGTEGCIIPFSVQMKITEEVVLVRDSTVKIPVDIWSAFLRENLAISEFTPDAALKNGTQRFLKDYRKANTG